MSKTTFRSLELIFAVYQLATLHIPRGKINHD